MMPRVLIAGCGYVGEATADLFHAAGWEVEGWTVSENSAARLSSKPYRVRAVDITRAGEIAGNAGRVDAMIHCASSGGGGPDAYRRIYLEGTRNLIAKFPRAHLLFTSSTSVYAQRKGEWVNENSPAEPDRETGRILRESEEVVLSHDGIVARLGGIYGPGRSFLLRKFLAGEALLDPTCDRFINQAHRDDIAAALFLLVGEVGLRRLPVPELKIYNVVDARPILQSEAYNWLATHFRRPLASRAATAEPRKRGDSNKRVSSERLRGVGWVLRYPTFQAAMIESVIPNLDTLGT